MPEVELANRWTGRAGEKDEWCAREDSNLHSFRNQILSLARLPIPPRARPAPLSMRQEAFVLKSARGLTGFGPAGGSPRDG